MLLTDTLGFARLVKVVSTEQHDSQVGFQLLYQLYQRLRLLPRVLKIFANGGFRGNLEDWVKQALHLKLDIVLKEEGQKGFADKDRQQITMFRIISDVIVSKFHYINIL